MKIVNSNNKTTTFCYRKKKFPDVAVTFQNYVNSTGVKIRRLITSHLYIGNIERSFYYLLYISPPIILVSAAISMFTYDIIKIPFRVGNIMF